MKRQQIRSYGYDLFFPTNKSVLLPLLPLLPLLLQVIQDWNLKKLIFKKFIRFCQSLSCLHQFHSLGLKCVQNVDAPFGFFLVLSCHAHQVCWNVLIESLLVDEKFAMDGCFNVGLDKNNLTCCCEDIINWLLQLLQLYAHKHLNFSAAMPVHFQNVCTNGVSTKFATR